MRRYSPARRRRFVPWLLLAIGALSLAGCSTLAYYAQSVGGQLEVLGKRRDIERVLAAPGTSSELRRRLSLALRIREFAVAELALPDNGSYRSYADLERPFVAWNVFATPEFSVEPLQWCFPFVGCLPYRGYFARADAVAFAERLRERGYEVFVGPVPAYSTLGWFDDPLLNTMIHWPEPELAGLLFHELAHQRLYLPGDGVFNESFATTVEREGVRRWLLASAQPDAYRAYLQRRAQESQFVQLVLATRVRLAALYDSELSAERMRARKQEIFDHLRTRYGSMSGTWGGPGDFDAWLAQELNNAQIASLATYHGLVPAFERLLAREGGDIEAFYDAAARLAALPAARRNAQLRALLPETAL